MLFSGTSSTGSICKKKKKVKLIFPSLVQQIDFYLAPGARAPEIFQGHQEKQIFFSQRNSKISVSKRNFSNGIFEILMRALFSYAILIKEKLFLKKVQTSHSYPPTYIVLMNDESSHGLQCKNFLQNVQLQFLCGKFFTQYFETFF